MKKYNVGIIGYGWVATAHIPAINATSLGQVTAVYSSRKLSSSELSAKHGGPIRAIRAAAARLPYAEHRKADPAAAGNCSTHGFSCKSGEFRSLD